MSIDPSSSTPLYQQVADDIRQQIRTGALPAGARLPPIRQLTTLYGVSIITINKALAALVSDGLVDSHVGRGTFVTGRGDVNRPHVIGFVLRDLSSPFFARVARGAQERAEEEGYEVLLSSSSGRVSREDSQVQRFQALGVEGMIVASMSPRAPASRLLRRAEIPVVMVSHTDEEGVPFVGIDPRRAGEIAGEHLAALGHREIGYVGGGPSRPSGEQVRDGLRAALQEAGLAPAPQFDWSYPFAGSGERHHYRSGYAVGEQIAAADRKPDAVLVFNDIGAIGLIDALLDRGLRVPEDIAVMGIDGIEQGARARVPLTTICRPAEKIGAVAVDTLIRRLRGKRIAMRQYLEPELLVRSSCGALSVDIAGGARGD